MQVGLKDVSCNYEKRDCSSKWFEECGTLKIDPHGIHPIQLDLINLKPIVRDRYLRIIKNFKIDYSGHEMVMP